MVALNMEAIIDIEITAAAVLQTFLNELLQILLKAMQSLIIYLTFFCNLQSIMEYAADDDS
jgi:hypothetical protein